MGRALSMDLRERILRASLAGESIRSIAKRLEVGTATVKRIRRQYREEGHIRPSQVWGHPPRVLTEGDLEVLLELVQAQPDATVAEFTERYNEKQGTSVSASTVGRRIREAGFTRKKRRWQRKRRTRRG